MPGNISGGRKAYLKNIERDPDFYRNIGRLGGVAPTIGPKGFAAMTPEKRKAAGHKGGKGRLGKKYPRVKQPETEYTKAVKKAAAKGILSPSERHEATNPLIYATTPEAKRMLDEASSNQTQTEPDWMSMSDGEVVKNL